MFDRILNIFNNRDKESNILDLSDKLDGLQSTRISVENFNRMISNNKEIESLLGDSIEILPFVRHNFLRSYFIACTTCGKIKYHHFKGEKELIESLKETRLSETECSFCKEYEDKYLDKAIQEKLNLEKLEEQFLDSFKIGDTVKYVEKFTDINRVDSPINPSIVRTGEIRSIVKIKKRKFFGENGYHYPNHTSSLQISVLDNNTLTNFYVNSIHQILSKAD